MSSRVPIRSARRADSAAIAALHCREIPWGVLSQLGEAVVRAFYDTLLRTPAGFGFVAEGDDGRLSGFAAGVVSWRRLYAAFLARHPVLAARAVARSLVQGRTRRLVETTRYATSGVLPAAELVSIAVEPHARGTGTADALVRHVLAEFAARGVAGVRVTAGGTNAPARRLYERHGFRLRALVEIHPEEEAAVYEIAPGPSSGNRSPSRLRRLTDLAAAVLGLLLSSPLFLVLAAVSLLVTGRPFFRQTRLGRDLRPFVFLKFQTMTAGADAGSTVTVARDARITSYGRVLRVLKLDELPQLINILRGEMSLVGPRPLTPNEVAAIPRHLAAVVYRVPPGLTGISAVAFSDEERLLARAADPERVYFEEILPRKVTLELAYAQRRTWASDLAIVLLTPLAPFLPGLRRRVLGRLLPDAAALVGDPARDSTVVTG